MPGHGILAVRQIRKCIEQSFHIPERHSVVSVKDSSSGQELLIETGKCSEALCVCLDKAKIRVAGAKTLDASFPFFCAKESGILSKNDALLFIGEGDSLFVFLIEMKAVNKSGYLLQLKSGKLFVEFVKSVLSLHGKCQFPDVKYFGVLCYSPRKNCS